MGDPSSWLLTAVSASESSARSGDSDVMVGAGDSSI